MAKSINALEAGDRLRQACIEKNINNPVELVKQLESLELPTAVISTVRDHWNGTRVGQATFWASYSLATEKSLDWLLFGKDPPPPQINQLRVLIDGFMALLGGSETDDYDPVLRKIVDMVKVLEPSDLEFIEKMVEELHKRRQQ